MLHLPADRLSELVEFDCSPEERAHLAQCAQCAGEVKAFARLREIARAERDRTAAPLLSWEELRPALREADIIRTDEHTIVTTIHERQRLSSIGLWSVRAAASLALLAGGVAIGRATGSSSTPVAVSGAGPAPGSTGSATNVSATPASFASREEAMEALVRAQQIYQNAAAYLVASDPDAPESAPSQYRTRLAALDEVAGVTRAALSRAPHDPVINSYYLATLGAREATLQQLQTSLPAGTRIDRF